MNIKFSIIIPAYNVEELIEDCLQSVVWQDYPKNEYEIIIVDDCSTDNTYSHTLALVDKYHRNPALKDLSITVFRHAYNKRQGGGRNTALLFTQGEYVIFLDSDDCWLYSNVLSIFSKIIFSR